MKLDFSKIKRRKNFVKSSFRKFFSRFVDEQIKACQSKPKLINFAT